MLLSSVKQPIMPLTFSGLDRTAFAEERTGDWIATVFQEHHAGSGYYIKIDSYAAIMKPMLKHA